MSMNMVHKGSIASISSRLTVPERLGREETSLQSQYWYLLNYDLLRKNEFLSFMSGARGIRAGTY